MQVISRSSLPTGAASNRPTDRPQRMGGGRSGTLLLFLLPGLAICCIFIFFPVIQAIYYGFFNWSGLGPLTDFIGLKNYATAFRNTTFLTAFAHNIEILALSLVLQIPLALCLALVIGKTLPGRTLFRTIFFLPFILSEVIAGYIWMFIYEPTSSGLVNATLQQVIPGFQTQAWLGDTHIVLFAIFAAMTWKYFGLHLVLYAAAIQNIPDDIVEAARIDGASILQVVRYIHLPLLGSTIRLSVFLSALGSLQYFDLIWIMSNGGPVHASETMATYLYKAGFQSFQLGYGSAVGVVMMLICLCFSLLYQRLIMRRDLAGSITMADQF
jgi:raffinose/stachyose/melibiose transport system permease protein